MENEPVDDGRPKGWTEAKCLEFIGGGLTDDSDLLAALFTHGDWREIHRSFPEFVKWMKRWN